MSPVSEEFRVLVEAGSGWSEHDKVFLQHLLVAGRGLSDLLASRYRLTGQLHAHILDFQKRSYVRSV